MAKCFQPEVDFKALSLRSVYMCGGEGFGAPPPQAESSVQGFRKARAHGEERKVWR